MRWMAALLILFTCLALIGCTQPEPLTNQGLLDLADSIVGYYETEGDTLPPVKLVINRLQSDSSQVLWLSLRQNSKRDLPHIKWLLLLEIRQSGDHAFSGNVFTVDESQERELLSVLNKGMPVHIESLKLRSHPGSTVRLNVNTDKSYSGGIFGIIDSKEIGAAGASYTTSSWSLHGGTLFMKDQAWDEEDNLIWGPSSNEGYRFVRRPKTD